MKDDLTEAQLIALRQLKSKPSAFSAKTDPRDPPTIRRMIGRALEERGLIEPSGELDRWARRIFRLTRAGEDALYQATRP